jgi:hypothetical protein
MTPREKGDSYQFPVMGIDDPASRKGKLVTVPFFQHPVAGVLGR